MEGGHGLSAPTLPVLGVIEIQRTTAKHAYNEDGNEPAPRFGKPVTDHVADIVDIWLLEDQLLSRKERGNTR